MISPEPGDTIVIYGDGIPESMNGQKELLGDGAIGSILLAAPGATPEITIERLLEAVRRHAGDEPESGDETIVVLRRTRMP